MLFIKLSCLYFFYFALLGLIAPYLGLYLDSQGFTLFEIAELASVLMMTKIIAPLLWGNLADKYQNSLFLVRFGAISSMLSFLGFFYAQSFWQYAFIILLFSFFWNAILPQIEVITLFNLEGKQDRYSQIRLCGSLGFISSVATAGMLFQYVGLYLYPVCMLVIFCCIILASFFKLAEPKLALINLQEKTGLIDRLTDYNVLLFFIICFLLQVSHGAYYTYFSIFLESLSYQKIEIGALWSLGVFAEVVLFVFMHKWLSLHTVKSIMLFSLFLSAIRWYFTAEFASNIYLLVILQCLHAFSFGSMHSAAIKFVHQSFHYQHQGRAQALYSSVGFGAGGALGAFLCGMLIMNARYELIFMFSAFVALIACVLCLLMRSKAYDNDAPETVP